MYTISKNTVFNNDRKLFETTIGLDNEEKTLLLSTWGKTETESRQNAVTCAWRLALKLSEDMMADTPPPGPSIYPNTKDDLIRPDESVRR